MRTVPCSQRPKRVALSSHTFAPAQAAVDAYDLKGKKPHIPHRERIIHTNNVRLLRCLPASSLTSGLDRDTEIRRVDRLGATTPSLLPVVCKRVPYIFPLCANECRMYLLLYKLTTSLKLSSLLSEFVKARW